MNDRKIKENGIEYIKIGNYYMPNLKAPEGMKISKLGKYGRLRLHYLKENKKAEYTILFMDNKLQNHLMEIDKIAKKRFDLLIKQLAEKENITEELKAKSQLEWVGRMNNIKNCAEKMILKELIYV